MTDGPDQTRLTDLETKLRITSQIHLTEVEAELRVEQGWVRIESGRTDIALRKRMAYWFIALSPDTS